MYMQTHVHKCIHAAYTHAYRKHFAIYARSYQLDIYIQIVHTFNCV